MSRFLIIKQGLGIGGTETLTIRMSNWLVNNDQDVILLTEIREEKVTEKLDPRIKRINYPINFWKLTRYSNAKLIIEKHKLENIDYIYGYGPIELCILTSFSYFFPNSKPLIGIYHPDAYKNFDANKFLKKLGQRLLCTVPEENIFFMNRPVQLSHQKILNHNFDNSVIWPLPVEIPEYKKNHIRSNTIISIGNLKYFKTYNVTMVDVIRKLRDKGYDVYYEIYGEGPSKYLIEEKIKKYQLENYVSLKGQVAYEEFHETVRRGFVFVGMGTAVLEASAASVPALCAVVNSEEPITFGYVNELPDYTVGEYVENHSYRYINNMIESLITVDDNKYESIRNEGYDYVLNNYKLDSVMNKFLIHAEKAKSFNSERFKKIQNKIYIASSYNSLRKLLVSKIKRVLIRNG